MRNDSKIGARRNPKKIWIELIDYEIRIEAKTVNELLGMIAIGSSTFLSFSLVFVLCFGLVRGKTYQIFFLGPELELRGSIWNPNSTQFFATRQIKSTTTMGSGAPTVVASNEVQSLAFF